MSTPWRVEIDASNQPTAAQAYQHGTTAPDGYVAPAAGLSDGDRVLLIADQIDGNGNPAGVFEVYESTWTSGSPSSFSRDVLVRSSTGSAIDWSAAGVDEVPRLRVLAALSGSPVELVAIGEISSPQAAIVIGVSPPFEEGWDYEFRLRGIVGSANAAIIALFWDPVAADWDTTSLFGATGYGGVATVAFGVNNWLTGFALLQSPTVTPLGNQIDVLMNLRDPADASTEMFGDANVSWFTSNHCRCQLALNSNTAKAITGVGFSMNSGNITAGTYSVLRRRCP